MSRDGFRGKQLSNQAITNFVSDKIFECCVTEFKTNGKLIIVAGVYRTPQFNNNEFLFRLNLLLELLTRRKDNIFVGGDFNINMLESSSQSRELKSHGLYYLIDFPNRVSSTSQILVWIICLHM